MLPVSLSRCEPLFTLAWPDISDTVMTGVS